MKVSIVYFQIKDLRLDFQKSVPFDDSNHARERSLAMSFFPVTGDQPVNKRIK